jgi:DNA modification methylase
MLLMKTHRKTERSNEPADLDLKVRYQKVAALKPYPGNARTHSDRQIAQIAASIGKFGFNNPILVDAENRIVAGHGRVQAAKRLGLMSVPTIRLDHLSDAERRAYVIADNRLAELAGWDREILRIELQGLADLDLDFDIEITGFDTAELDLLLDDTGEPAKPEPADEIPPVASGPSITRPGDLWLMGEHRLLCGDARDGEAVQQLMAQETARMVFTDPPYNVKIDGHVGGAGRVKHREFAMASGEMSQDQFARFLTEVLANMADASCDGSIHLVCMDWRHMTELMAAGGAVYDELKNLIVWAKTNGGMGTFYRSRHELIFVFKKGKEAHINTFGLGESGRYRTNVWDYPGINTFRDGRDEELAMHPTVKPVALVADAIKDVSRRGHIVLDAFGGSGTTLIAAEKTGRNARLLELDPAYCDVICRRFEAYAGRPAILAESHLPFAEVAGLRTEPAPAEAVS